jgi:glucose/arabinose dehydrogenase
VTPRLSSVHFAISAVVLALVVVGLANSSGSDAGTTLQGDADCSGKVDAKDALAILLSAANAGTPAECVSLAGDVNCDGETDEADLLALLRHVGGVGSPAVATSACTPIGDPLPAPTITATATQTPTATPPDGPQPGGYHLEPVLSKGFLGPAASRAVDLAPVPGKADEAVIVLQTGSMYRISLSGSFPPQLWGDLSDEVYFGQEQGLLSLTFSPDFAEDGRVYAYFTPVSPPSSLVTRFDVVSGLLSEESAETIIDIEDFDPSHQGGRIIFDQSGYLLLSIGDGGGAGDPQETGQDLSRLLGKVIRIDVSTESGYDIPADNPFVDDPEARPEIFALGFRNPWRMSIDRLTGKVWLGDVGQNSWEEVDQVVAGGNYGWDCYEGFDQYEFPGTPDQCSGKAFQTPRAVYDHSLGIAIVGGYVYRGSQLPELYGWYIYADYATGRIWAVDTESDDPEVVLLGDAPFISSFTEVPDGELLIISLNDGIYRLARN